MAGAGNWFCSDASGLFLLFPDASDFLVQATLALLRQNEDWDPWSKQTETLCLRFMVGTVWAGIHVGPLLDLHLQGQSLWTPDRKMTWEFGDPSMFFFNMTYTLPRLIQKQISDYVWTCLDTPLGLAHISGCRDHFVDLIVQPSRERLEDSINVFFLIKCQSIWKTLDEWLSKSL